MDHIRHLLPRANASRGEGAEFTAAAVVAAINDVLRRYGFTTTQARATSVTHRRAKIVVNHGAIGGRLRQRAENVLEDANTLLRQRFPGQPPALEDFYTKTS